MAGECGLFQPPTLPHLIVKLIADDVTRSERDRGSKAGWGETPGETIPPILVIVLTAFLFNCQKQHPWVPLRISHNGSTVDGTLHKKVFESG